MPERMVVLVRGSAAAQPRGMWHARTGESQSRGGGSRRAGGAAVPGMRAPASAGAATRPGAARRSPSSARSEFADTLLDQLKVLGHPESVPSAFQAEVATGVVLGNVTEAETKEGIKPETTASCSSRQSATWWRGLSGALPGTRPGAADARGARAAGGRRVRSRVRRGAGEDRGALPGAGDGTDPPQGERLRGRRPGTRHARGKLRHRGRVGADARGAVRVQLREGRSRTASRGDRHGVARRGTTLVVADQPGDKQLRRMEKDAQRHGSEVREVSHAEPGGCRPMRCVVLEIRSGTGHGSRRKVRPACAQLRPSTTPTCGGLTPSAASRTRRRSGGRSRRGGRWSRISSRHRGRRSCGTRSRARCDMLAMCCVGTSAASRC